jgi:hypothetical protein
MKTKRIVFIGLGVLVGIASILAGCQLWSRWPEVYQGQKVHSARWVSQIPFSLKEQGASLDILASSDPDGNALMVGLVAIRDASWNYKDENWERFFALIPDGSYYTGPSGEHIPDPKIKPFKLRVQIDSIDPDIGVHTDQTVVINSSYSMGLPRDRKTYQEYLDPLAGLKSPNAPPGIYRVRITNLEARPDVDWIPMLIQIGIFHTRH